MREMKTAFPKQFDLWAVIYDFIELKFPTIAKILFESHSKTDESKSREFYLSIQDIAKILFGFHSKTDENNSLEYYWSTKCVDKLMQLASNEIIWKEILRRSLKSEEDIARIPELTQKIASEHELIEEAIDRSIKKYYLNKEKKEMQQESIIITEKILRSTGLSGSVISELATVICRRHANQKKLKEASNRFFRESQNTLPEARELNPPAQVTKAINIIILLAGSIFLFRDMLLVKTPFDLTEPAFVSIIGFFLFGWGWAAKGLRLGSKGMRACLVTLLIPFSVFAIVNVFLLFSKWYLPAVFGLVQYFFYAYACLLIVKGEEVRYWFNPVIERIQKSKNPEEKIYIYHDEEFDNSNGQFGPFSKSEIREKMLNVNNSNCWKIILIKRYGDESFEHTHYIRITPRTLARYESYQDWTSLDNLSGLLLKRYFKV